MLVSLQSGAVFAASAQGAAYWQELHEYELKALRDYRHRNSSKAVLKRSDELWQLQARSGFDKRYGSCKSAARTLSQMVSGMYFDFSRSRPPADWYALEPSYRQNRAACLKALGLREEQYPLPWWFGI